MIHPYPAVTFDKARNSGFTMLYYHICLSAQDVVKEKILLLFQGIRKVPPELVEPGPCVPQFTKECKNPIYMFLKAKNIVLNV